MSADAVLLNKAMQTIAKDLDKATQHIADGGCRSGADAAQAGANYLYQIGFRDGLKRADILIRDAISRLSKGEE